MSDALGLVRSLVWLRWRLAANSIRGGQRRDTMERVSRALAVALPAALLALSAGSLVATAILGWVAARSITSGLLEADLVVLLIRGALAVMLALAIIVTAASPSQSGLARYNRLLLLPIPTRALHLAEVVASLSDPWILLIVPGLVTFAAALAFGGWLGAAATAAAAGLAFLALLAALGALIGFLMTWLFRSRRRGEMFTLVIVLAISLVSLVPAMFGDDLEDSLRGRRGSRSARQFSVASFDAGLPKWTRALPSELYGRAVLAGSRADWRGASIAIGGLAIEAVVLFGVSGLVHRKLLQSLEGSRARRRHDTAVSAGPVLPILGPVASAVAFAQLRTALRSVRGRLIVLLPGPMMAIMLVVFRGIRTEEEIFGVIDARPYVALGAACVFAIYAMQALTMNLFGSDRAGLSLQFLSPISDGDLARGKIAGCALMLALGVALAVVSVALASPRGSPALWLATVAGAFATFLLLSPANVWFSALFPVASDLSKSGTGGNPHGVPMLVGTVLTLLTAAPAAAIMLAADVGLGQPMLALAMMLGWLTVSAAVAWPLVTLAARTIGLRRENLALVAQGK